MKLAILLVGAVILILMWTNPGPADFEKWAHDIADRRGYGEFELQSRSKNYLLFSIHEGHQVVFEEEGKVVYTGYAAVGILNKFYPYAAPVENLKKTPTI